MSRKAICIKADSTGYLVEGKEYSAENGFVGYVNDKDCSVKVPITELTTKEGLTEDKINYGAVLFKSGYFEFFKDDKKVDVEDLCLEFVEITPNTEGYFDIID